MKLKSYFSITGGLDRVIPMFDKQNEIGSKFYHKFFFQLWNNINNKRKKI